MAEGSPHVGPCLHQSGNIGNPDLPDDEWIIDETVEVIHEKAKEIVSLDDDFQAYRHHLDDTEYMAAHDALRRKYFLPVRPLDYYLDSLRNRGFEVTSVQHRRIPARISEWRDFLGVYHEGVLGWSVVSERVAGRQADAEAVADRMKLIHMAMERTFGDAFEFGDVVDLHHVRASVKRPRPMGPEERARLPRAAPCATGSPES